VLRIHVVHQGGHHYYVNDLAPGRAEGTLVPGEDPGRWSGTGSDALGLRGRVEAGAFAEVLDGRDPRSGRPLSRHPGTDAAAGRVAGYDLVFAAPKSVSLLHLLAPPEIAAEVGAGHRSAVDEATDYLGRCAVGVRRTRNGQVALLASTGAVAGHFLHRTSRTLDPHLHTHAVTANVAQGVDGVWSAVDSRRVFAHARAAQAVYHARLRLELGDRIGATWEVPASGLGDVVGVAPTLRRLFSQRSAAIDEYEARRVGWSPGPSRSGGPARSKVAFHATRPDKDHHRTVDSLMAEWRERAADFGFDLGDLTRVVGPGRARRAGNEIDAERVRSRLGTLAGHRHTLGRRHLVAAVADASVSGTSARVVESVADRIGEASGPAIGSDRVDGHRGASAGVGRGSPPGEARWDANAVARAVDRLSAELISGPAPGGVRSADLGADAVDRGRLLLPDHRGRVTPVPGRVRVESWELGR